MSLVCCESCGRSRFYCKCVRTPKSMPKPSPPPEGSLKVLLSVTERVYHSRTVFLTKEELDRLIALNDDDFSESVGNYMDPMITAHESEFEDGDYHVHKEDK